MDCSKNYYDTLGVLPSAEPELIKAAFKALSKLYHPDINHSPDANSKMAEISEAYEVLSDKKLRAEYDSSRTDAHEYEEDDSNWGDFSKEDGDALEKDWKTAAKYHPEILELEKDLAKVSNKLSFGFKAYLLQNSNFNEAAQIALGMRTGFLEQYFGKDPEIIEFANGLIEASRKDALLELNNAIRVLGSSTSAKTLIKSIKDEFNYLTESELLDAYIEKSGLDPYTAREKMDTLTKAWRKGPRELDAVIRQIIKDGEETVLVVRIILGGFGIVIVLLILNVLL